jgi:hypothetical protein
MKFVYRIGFGALLLSLLLGFTLVSQAHSAEAKSTQAATSCYGQAFKIGFYPKAGVLYEFPDRSTPYVTSSHCKDINMKFTTLPGPAYVRICFVHANYCNSWKYYGARNTWHTPATDVENGTTYVVQLQSTASGKLSGFIAD